MRDVEGKKKVKGSEGVRIAVALDIHLAKMTARLVDGKIREVMLKKVELSKGHYTA
jgi:hypothetical protein